MNADFKLIAIFLMLTVSVRATSVEQRGKDRDDPDLEGFDEVHSKANNLETEMDKRKWSSNNMGLWGKRARMERDDPTLPTIDKRKWTSSDMAMWGRKRSPPLTTTTNDDDYYKYYDGNDDATFLGKRGWSPGGMGMWGKRLNGPINQMRSRKSKWASGSMGMWGKRSYMDQNELE